ncbi:MAG: ATP-dependent Clp protease proteolytic subunit [Treponema sp.]|nr:ATP-dependent Clp protease proteolytic subunit [Treponema sp.]
MKFSSIYNVPLADDDEEEKKNQKGPDPFSDRFLKTRQIILTGEINKELADSIVRQLLILDSEDSKAPIYMYIDSPGGDVDAGFAIFDMIRFVTAPVTLIGMGLIASAATLVLLAVPKEKRFGLPNSRYLIHQPLGGMRGVATDIEIYAKDMEKIRAKLNKIISDETGMALKQVVKDTERDYWLDSDEAVNYGLISKIVEKKDFFKKK